MLETSEGDFIVSGSLNLSGASSSDFFIAKLSSTGSQLWLYTYGLSTSHEKVYALLPAQNSHIYFAGHREIIAPSQTNAIFGEIDELGNLVRCKEYAGGGGGDDLFYSMTYSPSGNIVLTGSSTSFGNGGTDILIVELDLEGNLVEANTLGSPFAESARTIQYQQGHYLLGANAYISSQGASDVLIAKYSSIFDLCGDLTFNRIYSYTVSDLSLSPATIPESFSPFSLQNDPFSLTSLAFSSTLDSYIHDPLCSLLQPIII